jgi:hypothetical protein
MNEAALLQLFRRALRAGAGLPLVAGAAACSAGGGTAHDAGSPADAASDAPKKDAAKAEAGTADGAPGDSRPKDAPMTDVITSDAGADAGDACSPPVKVGYCVFTFVPLSCFPGQISPDAASPGPAECTKLCPTSTSTEGSYCYVRRIVDGGPPGIDCVSDACNP